MKQKAPNIVPILILTLITAVTWVFFSVYRALSSEPEAVVPEEISKPLDVSLDKTAIDGVKARLFLDDSQIPTTTFSSPVFGASPSSSPAATTIATPTPSTESTTQATPSGTLSQ